MTQKLILIRGVSGSGKSNLAEWLVGGMHYPTAYVEADQWMYNSGGEYDFKPEKLPYCHSKCQELVKWYLQDRCNVIVSNTSTTEKEVAVYQQIAQEYGVEFVSLVVERRHDGVNKHGVPDAKLDQQAQRLRSSLKI